MVFFLKIVEVACGVKYFNFTKTKDNQNADFSHRPDFNIHSQISIVKTSENTSLNIKSALWFNPYVVGFVLKITIIIYVAMALIEK